MTYTITLGPTIQLGQSLWLRAQVSATFPDEMPFAEALARTSEMLRHAQKAEARASLRSMKSKATLKVMAELEEI